MRTGEGAWEACGVLACVFENQDLASWDVLESLNNADLSATHFTTGDRVVNFGCSRTYPVVIFVLTRHAPFKHVGHYLRDIPTCISAEQAGLLPVSLYDTRSCSKFQGQAPHLSQSLIRTGRL